MLKELHTLGRVQVEGSGKDGEVYEKTENISKK